MIITKNGYQDYEICELVGNHFFSRRYIYYTKKAAIELFKKELANYKHNRILDLIIKGW